MGKPSAWPTTGEQQAIVSGDAIFITPEIRDFIKNDRTFILVASKGMGKTLLLRYKKQLIEKERRTGQLIIPANTPLDYVAMPAELGWDYSQNLGDYTFWEDIWELTITLSILTHINLSLSDADVEDLHRIIEKVKIDKYYKDQILRNVDHHIRTNIAPSSIFEGLLSGQYGSLNEYRRKNLNEIKTCYRKYVRSGVSIFIDSFDQ